MDKIERALLFATEAHFTQKRKHTGLPYVVHPIEVMKRVSSYGVIDEDVLCTALLHDVQEDSPEFAPRVLSEFGENIYNIMQECSRVKEADKVEFLKGFSTKSLDSIIIKIADRYCNVEDFLSIDSKFSYGIEYAIQATPLYDIFTERVKNVGVIEEDVKRRIMADISMLRKISVME